MSVDLRDAYHGDLFGILWAVRGQFVEQKLELSFSFGVTEFTNVRDMISVAFCSATKVRQLKCTRSQGKSSLSS